MIQVVIELSEKGVSLKHSAPDPIVAVGLIEIGKKILLDSAGKREESRIVAADGPGALEFAKKVHS